MGRDGRADEENGAVEEYAGEAFYDAAGKAARRVTQIVSAAVDSKTLEAEIDMAVGQLISASEFKGFVIGMKQCRGLLKIMDIQPDKPKRQTAQRRREEAGPAVHTVGEPGSGRRVFWYDGEDPETGRNGRMLSVDGEVHNVNQWCKICNCSRTTLLAHLFQGDEEFIHFVHFRKSF